jgi:hypothetical protein
MTRLQEITRTQNLEDMFIEEMNKLYYDGFLEEATDEQAEWAWNDFVKTHSSSK